MPILLNDNLDVKAPRPTDNRYGPYASTAAALAAIPSAQRYIGLTVGVLGVGSLVEEYWFNDGILDTDFVLKSLGIAYDQANAAYAQANAARDQANTARSDANTTFATINTTFGTINTNISTVYSQANAAYDAANNAKVTVYQNSATVATTQKINFINTSTITVVTQNDNGNANVGFIAVGGAAYDQANAAYNAANNAANTVRVSGNSGATLSSKQLNFVNTSTALVTISDSLNGNANISIDVIGGGAIGLAYDQANAAYAQANAARLQANTARSDANTTFATINTTFSTLNTNITTANTQANNAYDQANAARNQANTARSDANTTFATINTTFATINTNTGIVYAQANAAYNEANLKLNLTGGTVSGDLTVQGNLFLTGNATYINVATLKVNDSIIQLSSNSIADALDIGFVGHYSEDGGTTNLHAGFIRHASDNVFYIFDGYPYEPTNNIIDLASANLAWLRANVNAASLLLQGNVVATQANLTLAHNQANSARDQANTAYGQANNARDQANAARDQANTARSDANTTFATINTTFNTINTTFSTLNTNTGIVYAQANSARDQANASYNQANAARDQANTARSDANTTFATINTTFSTLNTNIGVVYAQANAAYNQANTAYGQANTAYGQANLAYAQANSAANTVRVSQNSGSTLSAKQLNFVNTGNIIISLTDSGDGNANVYLYTSNIGSQTIVVNDANTLAAQATVFYLSQNVQNINRLAVSKNGLRLVPTTHYTLTNNNVVTLATTAEINDEMLFEYFIDIGSLTDWVIAYNQANAARDQANTARNTANNAYDAANNRVLKSGDTMTGSLNFNFAGASSNFSIQNQNDLAVIEMGGANGAFIDMKSPNSDDFDFRIITIQGSTNFVSNNAAQVVAFTGGANVNFDSGTLFVDSIANEVGIGTTNPTSNLHVIGTANITSNLVVGGAITENTNGVFYNVATQFDIGTAPNQIPLNQYLGTMAFQDAAGVSVGTLVASGNVSTANLNIVGAVNITNPVAAIDLINVNNHNIYGVGQLRFNDPGPGEGLQWDGGNIWQIYESPNDLVTNSGGNLQFANNGVRRLTLNSSGSAEFTGNVGIGTSNPTSNLHVIGTANVSSNIIVGAGSASAPSYTTAGDDNTGIFFPAADTIAFAEGGTESMRIDSQGRVSIGATSFNGIGSLRARRNITGSTFGYGIVNDGVVQTDVTSAAYYYRTDVSTAVNSAPYTISNIMHYATEQQAFGANTTVTNQFGYYVSSSLVSATNNYGFYGNIPAGANRWNLYMNGTANNYIAGNVGIGTTTPTERLHIVGNYILIRNSADTGGGLVIDTGSTTGQNSQIFLRDRNADKWTIRKTAANNFDIFGTTVGAAAITILDATANVGIGSATPAYKLDVTGDARFTGNVFALNFDSTSDIRFKEDIQEIINPLETLKKLHGVHFTWKHNQTRSIGLIAQELEKVLPQLTTKSPTGDMSVTYNGIIAVLIEAVKELAKIVEEKK